MNVGLVRAAAFALLCVAMLATGVHDGFERTRRRVAGERLAEETTLRVTLPPVPALEGNRAALVLRLAAGDAPLQARILFDGQELTTASVAAGDERRIDTAPMMTPTADAAPHVLTVSADRAGWRLTQVEIANVHGFSEGFPRIVIAPAGYEGVPRPPLWVVLIVGALLLALGPWLGVPTSTAWRRVWVGGCVIVGLLFVTTMTVSFFTPFLVLMAADSFVLCVAVLFAPALARITAEYVIPMAAGVGRRLAGPAQVAWARTVLPYLPHVLTAGLVLWGVSQHYDPDVGFTRLIVFGSDFSSRAVPELREIPHDAESVSGYDGQFYAQLAFDPLLLEPETAGALDNTSYRARRLLVPAMAFVLGAGYPPLVIQIYALLNVGCWLLLTWLLAVRLPPTSPASVAVWLGCVLSQGMMVSMRLALTDGPSMLVLVLAAVAIEDRRPWLGAGVLGLAGLARETHILGALGLPLPSRDRRDIAWWVARGALVVAPIAVWIGVLWLRGFEAESGARNFAPPFVAYVGKWADTLTRLQAAELHPFAWFSLCALIALPTQALVLVWQARARWQSFWWPTGIAYACLMTVLGPAVWEGDPGAVTRALLPMTFAFNLLLPRGPAFWPLWVLGNLNLAHSLADIGVPLPWV